jgi:heterotetrameric sarcosine oxidase gamma subunit
MLGSAPCREVTARGRAALWLGPDEWLLLAPDSQAETIRQAVETLTVPASIVDVSHRTVSITIFGSRSTWCLNAFCALDLDPSAFPRGACTRTLFGKAEIVLWRIDHEGFQIEVARSLAPYVWACLEEARREFLDSPAAC